LGIGSSPMKEKAINMQQAFDDSMFFGQVEKSASYIGIYRQGV